jgi:hypothetical protein
MQGLVRVKRRIEPHTENMAKPSSNGAGPQGLVYSTLTVDDRRALLAARLRQLEAEHYQHDLNRRLLESEGSPEGMDQITKSMLLIERLHAQVLAELAGT